MAFAKKDPRINRSGRIPKHAMTEEDKPSRRALKDKELLMLLRKIKPHVADSVLKAAQIMRADDASHLNQLKAATLLLDTYRKLTIDMYDGEEDEENPAEEVQTDSVPVFSLRVVKDENNE